MERISYFVRQQPRRRGCLLRLLSVDLSENARRDVGRVYGAIKAEAADQAIGTLAALIEDALMRGIAEAIKKLPPDAGQEAVFEAAVTRVNAALEDKLNYRRLDIDLATVSGFLISQNGRSIVAAAWGRPAIILFHPLGARQAEFFDLAEADSADDKNGATGGTTASSGFRSLISGNIGSKDKLILATNEINSLVAPDVLKNELLAAAEPETAAAKLRELVNRGGRHNCFAVFIADASVETAAGETSGPGAKSRGTTQDSIEYLIKTQNNTKAILTPSFFGGLADQIRALLQPKPAPTEEPAEAESEPETRSEIEPEEPAAEPETEKATAVLSTEEPAPATEPATWSTPIDEETEEVTVEAATSEIAAKSAQPPVGTEEVKKEEKEPEAIPEPVAAATPSKIKRHFSAFASSVKTLAATLADRERLRGAFAAKTGRFKKMPFAAINRFNQLSLTSRLLLFAIMTVVVVLNFSLAAAESQRRKERLAADYDNAVAAVGHKIDSAEASLIYHDEPRAKELLQEAATMVEALPQRTQAQKDVRTALTAKVALKFEATRRAVKLQPPDIIANITSRDSQPQLAELRLASGKLLAAAASGELFSVTVATGKTEAIGEIADGQAPAIFLADGAALLAGDASGLVRTLPKGLAPDRQIALGDAAGNLGDSAFYGGRLYLLDASHNRILRVGLAASGFAKPQFYIKDATDVSNAISLDVDGSIFVLLKDGQVVQLMSGNRTDFTLGPVEPAIGAPRKIRTSSDSGKLYILDSYPARLLVYDKKSGLLAVQYESELLGNATDLAIDEKAGAAYFTSGNQILKFTLPEQK